MSDVWQGPGWWLASDGKWYPADAEPGAVYDGDIPAESSDPSITPSEPAGFGAVETPAAEPIAPEISPLDTPDVTYEAPDPVVPTAPPAATAGGLSFGTAPSPTTPAPTTADTSTSGGWQALEPDADAADPVVDPMGDATEDGWTSAYEERQVVSDILGAAGDPTPPANPGVDTFGAAAAGFAGGAVIPETSMPAPDVSVPTVAESAIPDLAMPETIIPDATIPTPPTMPDPVIPDLATPTIPDPVIPDLATPTIPDVAIPTAPDPVIPDLAAPTIPDPVIPETVIPDATIPTAPDPVIPDATIPTVPTAPDPVIPDATIPTVPTAPEPVVPDVAMPNVAAPASLGSESDPIARDAAWRTPNETEPVQRFEPERASEAPSVVDLAVPQDAPGAVEEPKKRKLGPLLAGVFGIAVLIGAAILISSVLSGSEDDQSAVEAATPETTTAPAADPAEAEAEDGDISVFELRAGDCIVGDIGSGQVTEVTKVDCEVEHQFEVYREVLIDSSITTFDEGAISAYAEDVCRTSLEAYVPATDPRGLSFKFLQPTEDSWNQADEPDRVVTCLLFDDDAPLIGRASAE